MKGRPSGSWIGGRFILKASSVDLDISSAYLSPGRRERDKLRMGKRESGKTENGKVRMCCYEGKTAFYILGE